MDIWGMGARAQDLIAWFFNPSVDAAEQVRRQKIRNSFLELMRAVKDSDILLFAAAVDRIGNNLEVARPSRAFDVVGGVETIDPATAPGARPSNYEARHMSDADVALEAELSGELIR